MKGLPGRRGAGFGHVPDGKFLPDAGGRLFRHLVGEADYAVYAACLGPLHAPHVVLERPS